jgi:hypothetical protein
MGVGVDRERYPGSDGGVGMVKGPPHLDGSGMGATISARMSGIKRKPQATGGQLGASPVPYGGEPVMEREIPSQSAINHHDAQYNPRPLARGALSLRLR